MLAQLFDLSLLKFQQRDDIAETFRRYDRKVRLQIDQCHLAAAAVCSLSHEQDKCTCKGSMVHAGSIRHAESLGCTQP